VNCTDTTFLLDISTSPGIAFELVNIAVSINAAGGLVLIVTNRPK
jgi:hypothetical protein